jgi:hypothetical protein
MIATTLRDRPTRQFAKYENESGIKYRNQKDKDWHGEDWQKAPRPARLIRHKC